MVSGYPATWLLTKRVSAVTVKNQNAESAMRSLVSAAKPWPRLELGTEYGFDTTFEKQTSGGTVFDYCKTIGQACDLGFRIVLDGKGSSKRLLFECFRPTFDPNRRYSPKWGNLLNSGWSFSDTDYANVALVQGAGEGNERATVWVGDVNATGSDRREMYIDARDIKPDEDKNETNTSQSYLEKLADRGGEKLLGQLEARAARNGYQLTHTPRVGAVLAARARSPYGARELRRQVDRAVEQALANQIASGTAHTGQHWTADCTVDGEVTLMEESTLSVKA